MLGIDPSSAQESKQLTPQQIELVREHLKRVTGSHAFAGGKRAQDFLILIVGHAMEGEIDSLRERMIGAEMFGRPIDYDTGSDSVVRVKATEVRKKLAQFYLETEEKHGLRIELPIGSYVPRFIFEASPNPSPAVDGAGLAKSDAPVGVASAETGLAEGGPKNNGYQPDSLGGNGSSNPGRTGLRPAPGLRPRVLWSVGLGLMVVALLMAVVWMFWSRDSNARKGIRSIAILPLKNLSGDPAQEFFADGMTEELINSLGQVSTLRVISLTSSMSYKGTQKKLPEIARELAVDGVVEGSVLREGNEVRISAQLIDAKTDRPIWAHEYVRDMTSTLALQGEVAQAVADEIRITMTPQEQARLVRARPIHPEAQDLYLHGTLLLNVDDCNRAVTYFEQAIEKNPDYAQAHAALASCYGRMGESGRMAYSDAFPRQKAEATRAIQLDDSLPEGHAELANTAMTLDWDWTAAATEFRRALELNPNSAAIHQKYAYYLVRTGQLREADAEVDRGEDLDPYSGRGFRSEGFIYYFSRHYDQALALIKRVQALDIHPPDWSFLLGDIYAEKGLYADAIAEFLKSGDDVDSLGHLGNVYGRAGRLAEARRTIARLQVHVQNEGVGRYEIALVYAGMGRNQDAFKWLEDAYRARDVGMVYLKIDPCLDPLRSDPRFDDLMRRVGLAK